MGFIALFYAHACITPIVASNGVLFRSSLTNRSDTIPVGKPRDTTVVKIDSIQLKRGADTLDAPLRYEADDSAVVLVREKRCCYSVKQKQPTRIWC